MGPWNAKLRCLIDVCTFGIGYPARNRGRPPKVLTGRVYVDRDRIVRALGNDSALHQKPE